MKTDISITAEDRTRLAGLIADRNTPAKVVWRARIVLASADGEPVKAICRTTGMSKPCVWRWQKRFADEGVDGLLRDKTRPPGRKPLAAELKAKVLAKTARETPPDATHWSVRTMAKAMGISHTSVQRIWCEAGLKPHLVGKFKVSSDPHFEEKVTDIVGLYMSPPDHALVLCVDEKSQIQALDRTQPGLPMKKGRATTMTHDYKRHGVTMLYAAMDVRSGLIGDCQPRHRAREFIAFLRRIDRIVQKHLNVHVVLDNSSTHKTDEVKAWLEKHPRFKLHFTPTSASWMNLVERFFAEITRKRIRRGAFASVAELEAAIEDYLLHHNADPKPFVWTKSAEVILKKSAAHWKPLNPSRTGTKRRSQNTSVPLGSTGLAGSGRDAANAVGADRTAQTSARPLLERAGTFLKTI